MRRPAKDRLDIWIHHLALTASAAAYPLAACSSAWMQTKKREHMGSWEYLPVTNSEGF
jgi:hypothetical protein